eukprot:923342-Amorphochlora_amoeboformis.AAC.1
MVTIEEILLESSPSCQNPRNSSELRAAAQLSVDFMKFGIALGLRGFLDVLGETDGKRLSARVGMVV